MAGVQAKTPRQAFHWYWGHDTGLPIELGMGSSANCDLSETVR
jgi:hypothetical protein